MCDSLPFDADWPDRLGNELLCPACRSGECFRCTARHSRAAWCEHPCRWLPPAPIHLPIPRKEPS